MPKEPLLSVCCGPTDVSDTRYSGCHGVPLHFRKVAPTSPAHDTPKTCLSLGSLEKGARSNVYVITRFGGATPGQKE